MDKFGGLFNRLGIRDVQLSTTECILYRDSQLLSLSGWSQCLTREVVIVVTIVDETDHLEWTRMIESAVQRGIPDRAFHVKFPLSSIDHRFAVTTKVLRRIPIDRHRRTADLECYQVSSESSCVSKKSSIRNVLNSPFPVFDVRPRLRSNVGIGNDTEMLSILHSGTLLPTNKSRSFSQAFQDSVQLQIYQGNIESKKRVHSIDLELVSEKWERTLKLNFDVTTDGMLTVITQEPGYDNANTTFAPRIIDVVCPKITIDNNEPYNLSVEWTENDGELETAILDISTTYAEIDRWRVSVAEAGVATGNGGGHVFLFPRDGFSQRFEIPSNILNVGDSYEFTVEGLQLIDVHRNFRIVCRSSKTIQILASQVNIDLQIQIERATFHQASVLISTNPRAAPVNRKWKISIKKIATTTGPVSLHYYSPTKEFIAESQRFDFPLQFEAGSRYRVTVAPMECSGGIYQNPDESVRQTTEFRAELTLEDINKLYLIAVSHTAGYGSLPCQWLYRNKSPRYFQDIQLNHGGVMKVYNKDNSGDPASPINLQIKGLFFMASVDNRTGQPPRDSPFGSTRIYMRAEDMLQKVVALQYHLYFVDYYCMLGKSHYVTLVMTKSGSHTDTFCAERLMPLSVHENPFLFYDKLGRLKVSAAHYLWVELLFTEDVDIHTGRLQHNFPPVGTGSSKAKGIPKDRNCQRCNLEQPTDDLRLF